MAVTSNNTKGLPELLKDCPACKSTQTVKWYKGFGKCTNKTCGKAHFGSPHETK